MHVALLNVNEPLFDVPLGDDAMVLRELGERLDRLTVVVATRRPRDPVALTDNVRLVSAPAADRARGLRAMVRALEQVHRDRPIDLVQAQECMYTGLAAWFARRSLKSKLTVGVFGADPGDPGFARASAAHRAASVLGRAILRSADAVQTDSRHTQSELARHSIEAYYKPMTPLNLDVFLAGFDRRRHRDGANRVLFVGRLGPQKHVALLLDAAARAGALDLQIVGDGPERSSLEERAARLGVRARFLGQLPHEELLAAYLDADLLTMSSHYEGMPRAFLEAGATGLPIVSTAVAGALELQRDAPVWIAPRSAAGYAATLKVALADVDRRRRCGDLLHAAMRERLAEPPPPEQQVAAWRRVCER